MDEISEDDAFELTPLGEEYLAEQRKARQVIRWFSDSPDAGDPGCICSLCGKAIPEDECAVRATRQQENLEARFHEKCFERVDGAHFQ
jgi:hypothetical protein